jgi:hypothetical protein
MEKRWGGIETMPVTYLQRRMERRVASLVAPPQRSGLGEGWRKRGSIGVEVWWWWWRGWGTRHMQWGGREGLGGWRGLGRASHLSHQIVVDHTSTIYIVRPKKTCE